MKTKIFTVAGLGFLAVTLALVAQADNHGGPTIAPVEVYACTFKDRKDADDLARVVDRWNEWADGKNVTSYAAYLMTPFYRSSEIGFDVAWLGGSPTGAAMASLQGQWITEGQDVQAEFNKVISCPEHSNFATITIAAEGQYAGGPVFFSDCKLKEGHTNPEGVAALSAWSAYLAEQGVEESSWALFPAFGVASKINYDFKWVTGYASFDAMGAAYDQYTMGGGYQKSAETLEQVLDCDSPRVYATQQIRAASQE